MKVMFLCGVFAKENEDEIIASAKKPIEYSANLFQEKIIQGFTQCDCTLTVLSAPFIGSYPNASSIRFFDGFSTPQDKYNYVKFNNVWGLRNISRAKSLKKVIRSFAQENGEKMIVIYSPHTPFLEAASFAKKIDTTIRISLIVPDLPQYMNLNKSVSFIYKLAKKIDIKKFNRLSKNVDSYMLLTENMKDMLSVDNKPYIVVEGIVGNELVAKHNNVAPKADYRKTVVYTGKLNEKFGLKNLIDAFSLIEDEKCSLVLCGKGDVEEYAVSRSTKDHRIICLGQVTPQVAREWVEKANVLVNPRQNNEEYTKYSFPSKNIEYLLSGKPVVGYMLDGMSDVYRDFIYVVNDTSVEALSETIKCALNVDKNEHAKRQEKIDSYLAQLSADRIAKNIIAITISEK